MPTNYIVLGMLIERVAHRPLAQVLRGDLLRPAGLSRMSMQDAERPATPRAAPDSVLPVGPSTPYLPNRAAASATWADSGMSADAASVARWGYLLYGSHVQPVADTRLMTTLTGPADERYGMATNGFSINRHTALGHHGEIIGFTAELIVLPREHISIAILITGFEIDATTVAAALTAAALTTN